MAQQQQPRPTGVTILAILAFVGGVLGILVGGLGTICGGVIGGLGAVAAREVPGAASGALAGGFLVGLTGLGALVLGILEIIMGFGFWTLKPWSWMLGMVVSIIGIVLTLFSLVAARGSLFGAIIPIAIYGVIIYYLLTPDVKKAFGRA